MLMMLAEEAVATASDLSRIQTMLFIVLGIQVLTAIALVWGHRKIAQNEVELGELIRKAVEQFETDLPKK
jgi:hypothetical protein